MKASLGRIVMVRAAIIDPERFVQSNGTNIAPAIITHVHSADETGGLVNTRAFLPDGSGAVAVTSIRVYADKAAADDAVGPHGYAAWWPERV